MGKLRDPRHTFRELTKHIKGVYAALGGIGPPGHIRVLYALMTFERPPTVSQLANAAQLNLKNTSRLLKILRKQGMLVLRGNPDDTRKRHVVLTERGQNLVELIHGSAIDMAFRIVEGVIGRKLAHPTKIGGRKRPL